MDNTFILDQTFSTTRRLTNKQPMFRHQVEGKLTPRFFLSDNMQRKGEGGLRNKGLFKKSYENKPLISVVTVVYNGEKHLEQTIKSVIEQDYDNVEYIIIDGGSTDSTLDIIKKYDEVIDYWVSEPDAGISDAFNKGIMLTTGECIGLLNADDWYEPCCISTIVKYLGEGDILHGKLNYWTNGNIEFVSSPCHDLLEREMSISHPTVFIKRHVYESVGLFNTSYKLAMDYEILLKAYQEGIPFFYIDKVLCNMRNDGLSAQHWIKASYEVLQAKIELGINRWDAYSHFITYTLWPHFKVTLYQAILNSPLKVLLGPYRHLKSFLLK